MNLAINPDCLSLRYNAACCIPLCVICAICGRINIQLTQSIYTNETPISPADPADNAEKDSYHIVECCSCLYNKSVREHACCSLLILCHFLILSLLFLSLLFLCSFLMCLTAVLTESKCRNKRKTAEYRLQSSISSQENVPKGTQKKDKKVPAKLCAEEACLLCHDEGTYSKKNSLA